MTKNIILFLLTFCFSTLKGQTIYQLTVSNLSEKPFAFKLNNTISNISPSQSITIQDSTGFDQLVLINMKINDENQDSSKVQNIQFIAENKSKIKIEVYDIDSIHYEKGFKLFGLPYLEEQDILKDFFLKKDEFEFSVKNEHSKKNNRLLTNFQRDSISDVMRVHRKEYLSIIENLIIDNKDSYLAYHLFKSEFLIPKNILTIGKVKTISIFELLDTSYNKTEIGEFISNYVQHLKSNSVGANIKNFKFRTYGLEEHDFYSYIKNSKALLIFTARGCKACIEQIPIIKDIEKELNPDIKIVYVSLDRSMGDWEKTMKSGNYPGLMTINLEPYNYLADLQNLFMVTFIPQLFLIDKDYTILYDNLSPYEDEKLTRLKKLLNIIDK